MHKRLHIALLLASFSLPASAAVMTWTVQMTPDQENHTVILNGSNPTGDATMSFNDVTNVLSINFDWTGLTTESTAAHIHCCAAVPGGNAGVVLGFWNPPPDTNRPQMGMYENMWDLDIDNPFTNATFVTNNGGTPLSAFLTGLVPAASSGRAYFNIHTETNPMGEIRGNLVPEPSSVVLVLSAIGLFAVRRLRK